MSNGLDFVREVISGVVDKQNQEYAICKAIDILLELKEEDEKIRLLLVKHFDIPYSVAKAVLEEAKLYQKQ